MVLEEYHEYLSLFDEKKSERFPPARTWDHKIKMKPTFEPKAFKPYKLSFAEIKEQEKFVEENLRKVSQKVTYLFCDELDIISKELRSRVRQATKDVVKSEV